jgi:hypothetical protein
MFFQSARVGIPRRSSRGIQIALLLLFLVGPRTGRADTVNLGVFSFDVLNPGTPQSLGVNTFSIDNLTGPTFNLPPDFPVLDELTFVGVSVTVNLSGGPSVVSLGDLAPGLYSPASASLEFLESDLVSSATLSASLAESQFALSDGNIFELSSQQLTANLLPSSGDVLSAGVDFALITASGTEVGAAVPEPSSTPFLLTSIFAFVGFGKRWFSRK